MSCHRDCNVFLNQDLKSCALGYAFSRYNSNIVTYCSADLLENYKKCIEQCNNSILKNQKKE